MAIISYDFGHGTGEDRGADGIVNEEAEIRKYAPYCIDALISAGHTCINCTPTDSNLSLMDSLSYRVNKANTSGSILHLCFHVNAYNGTAHGAEIEVASDAGERYGQSVLNEICKLGFTSRGINRPDLYVTKHTNMTGILIEPFFCDSKIDCNIYNPESLGNAIAQGVVNILGGNLENNQESDEVETIKIITTAPIDVLIGYDYGNLKAGQIVTTFDKDYKFDAVKDSKISGYWLTKYGNEGIYLLVPSANTAYAD